MRNRKEEENNGYLFITVIYTHPLACNGGVGASRRLGDSAEQGSSACGPTADMFVDAPISITVDGAKYYYLYDGLGSVTELIDENENVVNRYRYTPFGESTLKIEGVFNPYQYTGRRYDQETGQYYYRARMYSPEQGRFLSNDPLGMVDGPNMYAYVRGDPVNHRDPSGRWGTWYVFGSGVLFEGAKAWWLDPYHDYYYPPTSVEVTVEPGPYDEYWTADHQGHIIRPGIGMGQQDTGIDGGYGGWTYMDVRDWCADMCAPYGTAGGFGWPHPQCIRYCTYCYWYGIQYYCDKWKREFPT